MSQKQANLNIDELKDVIRHIVSNNRFIQNNGKLPVALEVTGESGLGKTTSIVQLAEEFGLNFVKLNLAQIEELGDLVGFPIRQFEMENLEKGDNIWVDEHAASEFAKAGYKFTSKNRMSYCPPEWIADKEGGGILLIDDWTRADVRFIQAIMELIDRQTYISWTLPKDWHIILTANPDNGEYNVNSIDTAQKTRFATMNLTFDIKVWARWAESNGIDSRCINFLLMHPELVTKEVNPRSITTFFNSISSIKNFENSLPLIQMLGEGTVGVEFSSLFTLFINNKLDKLIHPEEILFSDNEKKVIESLSSSIGKDNKYRADIASTISTRIVNYAAHYAVKNPIKDSLLDRIENIIVEEIFTNDLRYNIVKSMFNADKQKFRGLTMKKNLIKYITA